MFSSTKLFMAKPSKPAYFRISDGFSSNFVIRLDDPAKIAAARTSKLHVTGIIVKERACWNPDWSYHYDPATVEFFELSMEVCDATFEYTEEHLEEAGGAFLPGLRLCPWGSSIVEEITGGC
jgi:hypothetical protein